MPDVVYETIDGGGSVTLTYNAGNNRVTSVTVTNPGTRTWTGTVFDPASGPVGGPYTVGYTLTCPPGQTVSQNLPANALRVRQVQVDIGGGEMVADYEMWNSALGQWQRPIPYSSNTN